MNRTLAAAAAVAWAAAGAAAAASALSCGGSSGSSGGTGGGGVPPARDEHPELVRTFDVAPGTCGVSRDIALLKGDAAGLRVVRAPGGFVAVDANPALDAPGFLSLSRDGVRQRSTTAVWNQSEAIVAALPFAESVDTLHPVLLTAVSPIGHETRLHAWPLDAPGTSHELGAYFQRGTTVSAWASSLDGKRGFFAAEHAVTLPPHAVLFDATGVRSGDELVFEDGSVACFGATPTAAAAVLSIVYAGTPSSMRIVELGADGAVMTNVSLPLSSSTFSPCPLVQAGGPAPGTVLAAAPVDGALQIYAIAAGAATPQIDVPPALADVGAIPRWLSRLADGSFVLLVPKEGRHRLVQVAATGAVAAIPADLPAGDVIPGAPGELFIDVFAPGDTGAWVHRIVEVTCNGVGFGA